MTENTASQQAPRGPRLSLGNSAKSLHAGGASKAKSIRYAMQHAAGRLLFDPAGGKAQRFRVVHCLRSIQGEGVAIYRQVDGQRSRFGGLTTCGSGWVCPVCSQKIAEARREELSAALVQHVTGGGHVHLFTYTFPHDASLALADGMARLASARQRFKNSRDYKALADDAGRIGSVTSLEVTHGANGWHPHLHELVFVAKELDRGQRERLVSRWVRCLLKEGLGLHSELNDMIEHSLDIRGGEDAAGYVTKYGREEAWGLTSELTRSHAKDGRGDHVKPFGLLKRHVDGDDRAGALFIEFAEATHGRRMLTWSPGLRKHFALADERSDDDLAADPMPEEQRVAWITPEQWRHVLRMNARADLLDLARGLGGDDGQAAVDAYIERLSSMRPISAGWYQQPMRPTPVFH